jgi:hypothetical protein
MPRNFAGGRERMYERRDGQSSMRVGRVETPNALEGATIGAIAPPRKRQQKGEKKKKKKKKNSL